MAAVAVSRRVGVVLEQEDVAADALFAQPLLGRREQVLEDALASFVVRDQVVDRVALGRGVFGVRADVEVKAGAVGEKDVGATPPRHDTAEEVARHFIGAETALTAQGAGDPVFVLDPEDSPIHCAPRYPS